MLAGGLALGCARAPAEPIVDPAAMHGEDGRVTVEMRPSPRAAALWAADVHYRMVLAPGGTLGLLIVGSDQRILGHMRIAAGVGPHGSPGVRVEWEERDGNTARVEAWSFAGGLVGHAFFGGRSAAWRVRYESDGSLAGEGWSVPHCDAEAELAELHRARVLGADLEALVQELASRGVIDPEQSRALAERIAFAELALEFGERAISGRRRELAGYSPPVNRPNMWGR